VACHDPGRNVGNVPNSMSGVSRFQSMDSPRPVCKTKLSPLFRAVTGNIGGDTQPSVFPFSFFARTRDVASLRREKKKKRKKKERREKARKEIATALLISYQRELLVLGATALILQVVRLEKRINIAFVRDLHKMLADSRALSEG